MMSKKTHRTFKIGNRVYAIQTSDSTHEQWMGRFREMSADAHKSGKWDEVNAARTAFVRIYGVARTGFHLPPGAKLPRGMCFGRQDKLERLPVEEDRPLGTCWDDFK